MPATSWGAPARARCHYLILRSVAALLVLLVAASGVRQLAPDLSRTVLGIRQWYRTLTLPGTPVETGHFRVWLPAPPRGERERERGERSAPGPGWTAPEPGWSSPPVTAGEVAEQLERAYAQVTGDLGLVPRGAVAVVLHPDQASLEEYAGGAATRPAAGAYSAGVIHLVASRSGLTGLLAHELTHYLLDQVAPGRVPRWFHEGLAQLEEWRLTGTVLFDPAGATPIPWLRLEREFPRLDDRTAYGASLSAVSFLYHEGGDQALRRAISGLGAGETFPRAVERAWGRRLGDLEREWMSDSIR